MNQRKKRNKRNHNNHRDTRRFVASTVVFLCLLSAAPLDIASIRSVWLCRRHPDCVLFEPPSRKKLLAAAKTVEEGNSSLNVPYSESIVSDAYSM